MFLDTSSTPREKERRQDSNPLDNLNQKKKDLIERLRAKKAETGMNLEENECLSLKNHLSRASKKRFYAGATTLDPYYISSANRLSQTDFINKTLLLALQDNGKICLHFLLIHFTQLEGSISISMIGEIQII